MPATNRISPRRTKPPSAGGLRQTLAPLRSAVSKLMRNYPRWGMMGNTPPVTVETFEGARSVEDVRRAIEKLLVQPRLQVVDAQRYSGITQDTAGLFRATTLYMKYQLLEHLHQPLTEAAKVQQFERAVEAQLAALRPRSMAAISTLFRNTDNLSTTEWMSLAVETQDGKWFSLNAPHHHPWGGHIHDTWIPPAAVR